MKIRTDYIIKYYLEDLINNRTTSNGQIQQITSIVKVSIEYDSINESQGKVLKELDYLKDYYKNKLGEDINNNYKITRYEIFADNHVNRVW